MALKNITKERAPRAYNSNRTPAMGIIFKVASYAGEGTKEKPLVMTGTAVMGNDIVKEGQEITVNVNPERFSKISYDNLMGNAGKKPGSILMLDGAVADEANADVFNVSYANIVVSQKERADEESMHNSRRVLEFVSEVPAVRFSNPEQKDGEPREIFWPLNVDTRSFRGGDDAPVYNREWLADKIEKAGDAVKVVFDTYHPEAAEVVTTMDELKAVITTLIGKGNSAFIRAFDQEGEVLTRKSMRDMDGDADATIAYLEENGILADVENADLFNEIAEGNVTLEVMPMDRKYYVKSTRTSLLTGFGSDKQRQRQMIGAFGYGAEGGSRNRLARVYLPVQVNNAGEADEWNMPIGMMVRAGKFAGDFTQMPSPNYTPKAEADAKAAADAPGSDVDGAMSGDEPEFQAPAMGK